MSILSTALDIKKIYKAYHISIADNLAIRIIINNLYIHNKSYKYKKVKPRKRSFTF